MLQVEAEVKLDNCTEVPRQYTLEAFSIDQSIYMAVLRLLLLFLSLCRKEMTVLIKVDIADIGDKGTAECCAILTQY